MSGVELSHYIQRRIYNRLVGSDKMRYSELKPKEVEANLFMYHLNELIKAGLVEKVDKAYTLTAEGKLLATRFSVREQKLRIMPSTISVISLRSKSGRWLLYERLRQPFIGAIGWPSGKIHLGETLHDAAKRELFEKCGYENVALTLRGEFSLVEKSNDSFANHVLGHVWSGDVEEEKTFENHAGKTFWVDNWKELNYADFIRGFREIAECLKSEEKFVLDLYYDLTVKE